MYVRVGVCLFSIGSLIVEPTDLNNGDGGLHLPLGG